MNILSPWKSMAMCSLDSGYPRSYPKVLFKIDWFGKDCGHSGC